MQTFANFQVAGQYRFRDIAFFALGFLTLPALGSGSTIADSRSLRSEVLSSICLTPSETSDVRSKDVASGGQEWLPPCTGPCPPTPAAAQ